MSSNRMRSLSPRRSRSTSLRSLGSRIGKESIPCYETVSSRHSNSLKSTQPILEQQSVHSSMNQTVLNSQTLNGKTSFPEEQLISTQYSVDNSPPPSMTQKLRNLETLKSHSKRLNPQRLSKTEEIGPSPGTGQFEQLFLPFPIGCKNSPTTESISSTYSRSLTPVSITESLPSIKLSGRELEVSGILSCPISRNSPISKLRTWTRSGYRSSQGLPKMKDEKQSGGRIGREMNRVTNGTTVNAAKRKRTVGDCMCATSAERVDTREENVGNRESVPKRPKYLERSVWTDVDVSPSYSPTAWGTLSDDPLPRPPPEEFANVGAVTTIHENPHLFRLITPINVDRLEKLLESHPNVPFVKSVCISFREGFWPWANTQKEKYPITWDFSDRPPKTELEAGFLRDQRDVEIAAGRYSEGFGKNLLPGMYSTPIHAIPKPRSEKLRLVNDHSAGTYSLNSMIAREDVAGARMDSISDLIGALLRYRKRHPNTALIRFKSDVSAAYRRLPLHPLWQIKQIVTVDEIWHVDRCTSFGGRGSCRDSTCFMGLVLWIAIFIKSFEDLFGYIDDNFSFEEDGNVMWYDPYQCYYPTKRAKLLYLWDEINLPHDKSKQEYAAVLCIIGFMVDPQCMRVSMDNTDQEKLIQHVSNFSATAPGGTRRTLREFQQLAGWVNWSFNVFLLLKPALSNVYMKIKGKTQSHAKIFVSKAVIQDLTWFVSHVQRSDGVSV